jgi:predicted Zn-dependent peptidase
LNASYSDVVCYERRLYFHLLTFSFFYKGLWGVYAEAQPGNVSKVVELLTGELSRLKKEGVSASELEGAKNRAKAAFVRSLDSPKALANYLGRKASASGNLLTPTEFVSKLDKLTVEDIFKVAESVLSTDVTLVCVGDVDGLPTAKDVQSRI